MKHVLFVCSQNRLRSPTAEQVFSTYPGIECASAGTNHDANVPISAELVELIGGTGPLVERAQAHLAAGRPLEALHFAEMALAREPQDQSMGPSMR